VGHYYATAAAEYSRESPSASLSVSGPGTPSPLVLRLLSHSAHSVRPASKSTMLTGGTVAVSSEEAETERQLDETLPNDLRVQQNQTKRCAQRTTCEFLVAYDSSRVEMRTKRKSEASMGAS
jgi:hypothetical protein